MYRFGQLECDTPEEALALVSQNGVSHIKRRGKARKGGSQSGKITWSDVRAEAKRLGRTDVQRLRREMVAARE